jgi:hypothetical protein
MSGRRRRNTLGLASSNVRSSPLFVVSTDDGLLGKEAKMFLLKKLSARLAEKCWEKPYSPKSADISMSV